MLTTTVASTSKSRTPSLTSRPETARDLKSRGIPEIRNTGLGALDGIRSLTLVNRRTTLEAEAVVEGVAEVDAVVEGVEEAGLPVAGVDLEVAQESGEVHLEENHNDLGSQRDIAHENSCLVSLQSAISIFALSRQTILSGV